MFLSLEMLKGVEIRPSVTIESAENADINETANQMSFFFKSLDYWRNTLIYNKMNAFQNNQSRSQGFLPILFRDIKNIMSPGNEVKE